MHYIDAQIELEKVIDQDQDYETINAIYDKYERLIYSFAYRITQDADLASQAAAKVFLALWRHPALTADETRHFLAALLTMTRKFSLEALKGDLQAGLTIEEVPDWQEKGAELSESLLHLKESHQLLLKWLYFEGLSQYAIAKRLKIPSGSVPNRIREAFSQLDPSSEQLKNKKTCPFSGKLADYFTFQLMPTEAGAFEEHLAGCATCQAELSEWQRLTEGFPYLSEMQVPPDKMKEQVLTAIVEHQKFKKEEDLQSVPQQTPKRHTRNKQLSVLATVLMLSLGTNIYVASSKLKKVNAQKHRKKKNDKNLNKAKKKRLT